jgi:hypothetical protein
MMDLPQWKIQSAANIASKNMEELDNGKCEERD